MIVRYHNGSEFRIRNWADKDEEMMISWLNDSPATNVRAHGKARTAVGSRSQTLVVETDSTVFGVGTIHEYWLHPAHWRIAIDVHPDWRRNGIGSLLLQHLLKIGPDLDSRPVQASTDDMDFPGTCFLQKHEFSVLMKTMLGVVHPNDISRNYTSFARDMAETCKSFGYQFLTLAEWMSTSGDMQPVVMFHEEIYRSAHWWNPMATIDDEMAQQLFLDEHELIPEAMLLACREGRPVAVSSLRRGASPQELELAWTGVLEPYCEDEHIVIAALLGRCLEFAERSKARVRFEADKAEHVLHSELSHLPIHYEPAWLPFIRHQN